MLEFNQKLFINRFHLFCAIRPKWISHWKAILPHNLNAVSILSHPEYNWEIFSFFSTNSNFNYLKPCLVGESSLVCLFYEISTNRYTIPKFSVKNIRWNSQFFQKFMCIKFQKCCISAIWNGNFAKNQLGNCT